MIDVSMVLKAKQLREEAARRKRVDSAIGSWKVCCVPGCSKYASSMHPANLRDYGPDFAERSDESLPMCDDHMRVAWRMAARQLEPGAWLSVALEAEMRSATRIETERREKRERDAVAADGSAAGHIYAVRQNGLIKFGWSSQVRKRLRAYGPDVDLLCVYPASRRDEADLHRSLKEYRARGHEWYTESQLVIDIYTEKRRQHGIHGFAPKWSTPRAERLGTNSRRR